MSRKDFFEQLNEISDNLDKQDGRYTYIAPSRDEDYDLVKETILHEMGEWSISKICIHFDYNFAKARKIFMDLLTDEELVSVENKERHTFIFKLKENN